MGDIIGIPVVLLFVALLQSYSITQYLGLISPRHRAIV